MSFFGDLWSGIKNVGSSIVKPIGGLLSQFAPTIGGMLGQRFGGAGGAQLGSSLGNVVSGLTGGGGNTAQGLGQLGQAAAQRYMPQAPSWMQNTPVGQFGGTAGARAGNWLGQQAGNLLPQSMQNLAPHLANVGTSLGRNFGNLAQRQIAPNMSPQMAATTMGQLPAALGNRAGSAIYNRTAPGRAAAHENMQHFAELPGMAGGGYVDPSMGGSLMHSMPYGGGHGPVMFNNGGYAEGGHMPHYDMGGYADGGYAHHYGVGGSADWAHPQFSPGFNLQGLVQALHH
jgi:hypothetical protein